MGRQNPNTEIDILFFTNFKESNKIKNPITIFLRYWEFFTNKLSEFCWISTFKRAINLRLITGIIMVKTTTPIPIIKYFIAIFCILDIYFFKSVRCFSKIV